MNSKTPCFLWNVALVILGIALIFGWINWLSAVVLGAILLAFALLQRERHAPRLSAGQEKR